MDERRRKYVRVDSKVDRWWSSTLPSCLACASLLFTICEGRTWGGVLGNVLNVRVSRVGEGRPRSLCSSPKMKLVRLR
jgi:hypothetical protein